MSDEPKDVYSSGNYEEMTLEAIGHFIFLARKEKGWTQDDLAEAAGLSKDIINAMENGRRKAGIPAYNKVAQTLGISFAIGIPIRESDNKNE